MNKKLIAPIVTAAAMLATSVGSTFALFSSKASSRIDINAGKLEVKLDKVALHTYSVEADASGDRVDENGYKYSSKLTNVDGVFTNGGTADFADDKLALKNISPGDRVTFDLKAAQGETNISYKYRVVFEYTGTDETIGRGMIITTNITGETKTYSKLKRYQSAWLYHDITTEALDMSLSFDMELPVTCGNKFQEKAGAYSIYIETVQGNAAVTGEEEIKYFPDTTFGFYDSRLVDEGLETEHWVHEISTVEEYRNIGIFSYKAEDFKTEYEITSLHFCDEKTEYVLLNDIDCFGVSPWYDVENACYYELSEGKTIGDFVFTGVLNGKNNTIKNIKATVKMGQKVSTDECDIGGLFDAVHNITIKDLKVSNVVVDNAEAKPGAVIACGYPHAAGLGASSLNFENVVVDESCAVYGKQGCAGFLGYARNDASDISFKNCVNGADIICSGSNLGGFLGSNSGSSAGGRTFVFDGCENKGNISGQQILGGFAGTQTNGCTWTIKDSTNSGNITSSLGNTIGLINGQISSNDSISYTNVTNSGFVYVPTEKVASIKNSGKEFTPSGELTNIHFENEPVEATKGDLANQFVKEIVNTVDIGISFNATTHAVEFSNTESLPSYTRVVLDVNLGAVDKFDLQTSKMISSGGNTALTQTKNTIEEISAKEISRVGWIKPTATTPTGTFGNSGKNYDWYEDFMIPFSERDNPAYSTGYHEDELGGYYTIDNKDAVTTFGQIFKLWTVAEWNIYVYDGGTVVGHGYWRTPGAPDGRQTYFTNVYQAA